VQPSPSQLRWLTTITHELSWIHGWDDHAGMEKLKDNWEFSPWQPRRKSWQPRGARMQVSAAADAKNILVMGGTRFIGLFLSRQLIKEGHQVSSTDTFLHSDCFL
jgi:hypothetical protein